MNIMNILNRSPSLSHQHNNVTKYSINNTAGTLDPIVHEPQWTILWTDLRLLWTSTDLYFTVNDLTRS